MIMLFDPELARPVAFRILENIQFPLDFSIVSADAMPGAQLKGPFSLRILTDKNNQPFESAPGELIVRSAEPLPLGSHGLNFILDQEYSR